MKSAEIFLNLSGSFGFQNQTLCREPLTPGYRIVISVRITRKHHFIAMKIESLVNSFDLLIRFKSMRDSVKTHLAFVPLIFGIRHITGFNGRAFFGLSLIHISE